MRQRFILFSILTAFFMVPACTTFDGPSANTLGLPSSNSEVDIQAFHSANKHGQVTQFQFIFSESVNREAVEAAITLSPEATEPGHRDESPQFRDRFVWDALGTTLTYLPSGQLEAGSEYEVSIRSSRVGEPALHRAAVLVPNLDVADLAKIARASSYADAAEQPLSAAGARLS